MQIASLRHLLQEAPQQKRVLAEALQPRRGRVFVGHGAEREAHNYKEFSDHASVYCLDSCIMDILSFLLFITWSQWGGGPRHTGSLPVLGDRFTFKLHESVVDPHVPTKRSEAGGALLVHYQTPLSDGNEVFMEAIGGTYTTSGPST